jgi:hypothetical protein
MTRPFEEAVTMRRVSPIWLAGAVVMTVMLSVPHGIVAGQEAAAQEGAQPQQQQEAPRAPALTFDGEVALWTIGVVPDRTRDFEAVMSRLREVLRSSEKPERRRQAEGWQIVRGATNPQTGHVMYIHMINPVVRGADYNVLELIWEVVEDHEERTKIYEQYRASFGASLGATTGQVVLDFSR